MKSRTTTLTRLALSVGLLATAAPARAQLLGDTDLDGISDSSDAFPCAPEAAAASFFPAQGIHGTLLYEDQWPQFAVDYDYNDLSLNYNYVYRLTAAGLAVSVRMTFNAQALGGVHNNGLAMRLPVSASNVSRVTRSISNGAPVDLPISTSDAELTFDIVSNLRTVFGGQTNQINSLGTSTAQTGETIEVEVFFSQPTSLNLGEAPYDVFIFRTENRGLEIHLPKFNGTSSMDITLFNTGADASGGGRFFVNRSGLPYALHIPDRVDYPAEGVDISLLYPRIVNFAASGGTQDQDFYLSQVDTAKAFRDANGGSAPLASFIGYDHSTANTSCIMSWGLALEFGRQRSLYAHATTQAPNGDVIVTGYVDGALPNQVAQGGVDAFVTRYDAATGAEVWTIQVGSPADDVGRSVAVNEQGDIFVAGDARGVLNGKTHAGQTDAFLMRLDASGTIVWTQTLGGTGVDSGTAVAVDPFGHVIVGGGSTTTNLGGAGFTGNNPNSYIASYNLDGTLNFVTQYATDPASPSNYNYTLGLNIDPVTGDIVTAGAERRYNQSGSAADSGWVARHSGTTGALLWVNHLGGYGYRNTNTDQRYAYAYGVGIDPLTGAAYVTGHWNAGASVSSWGPWVRAIGDVSADAFFSAFTAGGKELFNYSMGSAELVDDFGESVTVASETNAVYFTGRTAGTLAGPVNFGGDDYFVAAYAMDGTQLWVVQNGTAANDEGHTTIPRLTVNSTPGNPSGDIMVIGNSAGSLNGPDAHLYRIRLAQHQLDTGTFVGEILAAQYSWATGAFSQCSTVCGTGFQFRSVYCADALGNAVSTALCVGGQPTAFQLCQDSSGCTYSYAAGAFSACTGGCGQGTQTRSVDCVRNDGSLVDPSFCQGQQAPSTTQVCTAFDQCTYTWFAGVYGPCSTTCGSGTQGRSVYCERSDGTAVVDSFCNASGTRPSAVQACVGNGACSLRDFTSCGATGPTGPTGSACLTAYAQSLLLEEVGVTNGIQRWGVPQTGTYRIEVWGAGGSFESSSLSVGGKGAYAAGDFQLAVGTQLEVLVGQSGVNGGGGGGSFIWHANNLQLLIAAGGGGGATLCTSGSCVPANGVDGATGLDGTSDNLGLATSAGTAGNGAVTTSMVPPTGFSGGGGAGWLSSGVAGVASAGCSADGGDKPTSTGAGGASVGSCSPLAPGGFGGGGAALPGEAAGGGGGYSGGGAGIHTGTSRSGGGAGGSFNTGSNQAFIVGDRVGDGLIRITLQ